MANTTSGLKNVNLLNKTQYAAQTNPASDELWAVDIDSDTEFKNKIVDWGSPDYSAGVSISSGYTTTKKGVIYCTGYYGGQGGTGGGGYCWCQVGFSPKFLVAGSINSTEGKPRSSLFIAIDIGESCTFGTVDEGYASGSVSATFYPLKGVK